MNYPVFPGYVPRKAKSLSVTNDIKAKFDSLPIAYSNQDAIFPTILDTQSMPPDGLQSWLEKIIADAVTAEEGRLFIGAVVAVVFGGILLKWL